MRDMSQKYI